MGVKHTSNYKQVVKELDNRKKRMMYAVGAAGEAHVKLKIQELDLIDTGALLNSISHKEDESKIYIGSTLTSEDYPLWLERGTSRMAAKPYLRPGIMDNLNNLKQIAEKNFK